MANNQQLKDRLLFHMSQKRGRKNIAHYLYE